MQIRVVSWPNALTLSWTGDHLASKISVVQLIALGAKICLLILLLTFDVYLLSEFPHRLIEMPSTEGSRQLLRRVSLQKPVGTLPRAARALKELKGETKALMAN